MGRFEDVGFWGFGVGVLRGGGPVGVVELMGCR